jgi:hypothetical protein
LIIMHMLRLVCWSNPAAAVASCVKRNWLSGCLAAGGLTAQNAQRPAAHTACHVQSMNSFFALHNYQVAAYP